MVQKRRGWSRDASRNDPEKSGDPRRGRSGEDGPSKERSRRCHVYWQAMVGRPLTKTEGQDFAANGDVERTTEPRNWAVGR